MSYKGDSVDVVVIGAGHAGCEAALAAARMGMKTIIFAISLDSVAMMPCNPNIGGTGKGHLVREIDALGGEMGKNIDKTFIQSRMLNSSKGPAVHSLRAQADKKRYSMEMKKTLENEPNLKLKQAEIRELIVEDGKVKGVITTNDMQYDAKAVVIATGTYLKAFCITGDKITYSGPSGLHPANYLSESLEKNGIKLRRYKTGTPSRVDGSTIDYSKTEIQPGDEKIYPFSFTNTEEDIKRDQINCYLTYTNEKTHEIIKANLDRSPLFNGTIVGVGPRYCPSIETKVMNFADKDRHQIFLEPEGENTNEVYLGGLSSSLPEDVQIAMIRTMPGLENAEVMRIGYAIEYDSIDANDLKPSLETKAIEGLFTAGQFNGSSGYEEAGAQGIIAGINAAQKIKGLEPLILDRSEAYIGVLVDDLVTKESHEPYRMMTSRCEYRLVLRQDNADLRLSEKGYELGLISEERIQKVREKKKLIEEEIERLNNSYVGTKENVQELLRRYNSSELTSGVTLSSLVKRPELNYDVLKEIDVNRPDLPSEICEQVNIQLKYDGYINNEMSQIKQFKKLEKKLLPEDLDYTTVQNLRIEAQEKLNKIKPRSLGQASRISGVSPADITVLLIYLEKNK
ncbi:MAG: tRNA uridine-5-carboxymethylaminomethyl(34) synthesis enzyme MnmG [Clostridia bacterium]|nr:tRNA uridine-5-carboxymethylaminomethyl(34) synthesis enzyme MnmG [Clostridia bacterium]